MLSKKRTKMSRMRGSSSHGGGHKKKRRGAGNKGGKGLAGSGARADQKKSLILTTIGKKYFGKKGFNSIKKKKINTLSLNYIENNFDKLVKNNMIKKEGNKFIFDSTQFNYNKILGKNKFSKKLTIICEEISSTAKKRVEELGGEIILKYDKKEKKE